MHYGMVIDLNRCVGCNACAIACKQAHATGPGVFWNRVLKSETGVYPNAHPVFMPILCNHCSEPACVDVCPTGATRVLDNGIVVVDEDMCVGCRYCMLACPYNARSFNFSEQKPYYPETGLTAYEEARSSEHVIGTVEKCNFCFDRLEQGLLPICVQACPAKALNFGDMDDPESNVSQLILSRGGYQLLPELGTKPSVYYLRG